MCAIRPPLQVLELRGGLLDEAQGGQGHQVLSVRPGQQQGRADGRVRRDRASLRARPAPEITIRERLSTIWESTILGAGIL